MTQRNMIVHPLVLRRAQVERVADLNSRTRSITLTGAELGAFERDGLSLPAFDSPAFDDHVKLIFATDGDVRDVLPAQLQDGIDWPRSDTRAARDYTPRRFDPATGELDLEFVLHGDGPAASWARTATPGDELWFAGPKASTVLPAEIDWMLMAGDETALPAIARFFDERPIDVPVRAVIAIADDSARRELPTAPGDRVEWIVAAPGDADVLIDAVRSVEPAPGRPYVWAAAESRALLPLRRHVSRELDVPKHRTGITGYWHRRDDEGDRTASSLERIEPPTTWFAIRAALRLGLVDALAASPLPAAALATQLGVDRPRLTALLDVLAAAAIVTTESDSVALGPAGDELLADDHAREAFTGLDADRALTLAELAEAIELDESAWSRTHGLTMRQSIERDHDRYTELVDDAAGLVHLITGLPRLPVWGSGADLAVTGPGALVVADLIAERCGASATVVEHAVPLAALREADDDGAHRFAERWGRHDVAATALALAHRTDDEAVALLRELRAVAPAAVLVESLSPDALGPRAAEQALLHLASVGTAPRTPTDIALLASQAGWTVAERRRLGWGVEYFELTEDGTGR